MIEWVRFTSKEIAGFPMGDPESRDFPIYLPPRYSLDLDQNYPVIFLLAGYSGRASKYISDDSVFSVPLHIRMDRAIEEKRISPVILVFPDGTSKLGCSQYINSPAFGNYMNYICDELTSFIDLRYRTRASSEFRGIMGHSSGGFGALVTGMFRPDKFKFICSSAGDSFYEALLMNRIGGVISEIQKAGGIEAFIKMFLEHPNPSSLGLHKFETLMLLNLAPCYAPNLAKPPLYGDVFFDLETGAIQPEIWDRYMRWDPVHMVNHHIEAFRSLRWIHLEAGLQDEYALQFGHRQIAERLRKADIPFQLEEYPGGHSGHHWRFESRIEKMLRKMLSFD